MRAVTLALAGDVMLGRRVNETIAERGFAYPWGDMLPALEQVDLFLVNLECALTSRTERWHEHGEYKPFYFRGEPSVVNTLRIGRVDFTCLANNHLGDFGPEGLLETLEVLDGGGIAHAGGGANLAVARRPAVLSIDSQRISVVAFADHPSAWAATESSPGINYTPISVDPRHFAAVEGCLTDARQQADFVIFTIHWGPNMRARPTQAFREFARRVVDAGADVFWGHSAHVPQGIEVYRGKPILFDTGDFIDDYAVTAELRNDLSALFVLKVKPPSLESLELVPVQIARMQVNHAKGAGREWIVQRLSQLSAEMGTRLVVGDSGLSVQLNGSGISNDSQ
jgi:poly-gamma-glutamate capsule biosynthesis protein CapA/YwtB (metallophosphatase superfamily)